MIGQIISHYKILEKLGTGGMGVVYMAEDTRLNRKVALKFLPPELIRDEEAKQRFIHEAQSASSLQHNNICTIHDIQEFDEGKLFIVMDFYEGESLKDKIARGPLKMDKAINIISQVANGLKKAHDKGIVHRDIKPANIFITNDGIVKILDFGLAKTKGQTQLTQIGSTVGTVNYMSPEQARGNQVDRQTDIWSMGVVLYEMVTGCLPFKGEYEQAVLYLILNEEPEFPSKLNLDVPSKLEHIVSKALTKSKSRRYNSLDALLEDLSDMEKMIKSKVSLEKAQEKTSKPSIAVLPFKDMSPQKDQEYFCEGIAEELINTLVKLDGLRVVARTSAFQFKDRDCDIKKIGSQLEVDTVLEGSVRKAGEKLRITAQLINISDGFHLWSEKYDRKLEDIFTIQDEISLAITEKLKVKLLGQERTELVRHHTVNQEAYNLYLKGLYFWNRRIEGGMRKAMNFYKQAIGKDPDYALAHVGIADVYNMTGFLGFLPSAETFPKGKAAAEKALAIDNTLGEAYASLAWATACYDWNWSAAEKLFIRAIELNPRYPTAHEWYGIFLSAMGRFNESIAEAVTALELDPLSLIINSIVGLTYYFARRYDESIANLKKALEMDPNFLLANTYIVMPYLKTGRYDDAINIIRKAEPLAADNASSLAYFGGAYGSAGLKDDALLILANLDELAQRRYVSPIHRAEVLVGIGEFDEALNEIEKSIEERSPGNIFLNIYPYFDCLRSNKRFQVLLKKIGLYLKE